MNKTIIAVAGGASAVSLAAGAAGGYFYAKKKFNAQVEGLVALEVLKTKKYFGVLLAEAKAGNAKPADPADLVTKTDEEELELEGEGEEELSEKDLATIAEDRKTRIEASEALTNYQGYSKSDAPAGVIENNIFSNTAKTTKKLPPRGPGGKFVPKSELAKQREPEPQIIDERTFLLNEDEPEQKSLLYFKGADTLIDVENNNEPVENAVVGEVNLTLFEGDGSYIYVRNEGLGVDYQIQLMEEDLTEFLGLGVEDGGDFDETDAAEHRIAREDEDEDSDELNYA